MVFCHRPWSGPDEMNEGTNSFHYLHILYVFEVFFLSLSLSLFVSPPMAYGTSQSRGLIGAAPIATAMPDPSRIQDLHHSLHQYRILNPLRETRDQTCILMDISRVLNLLSHNGNSSLSFLIPIHQGQILCKY